MTTVTATIVAGEEVLPMRMRHREEMHCQIVHDSIHRRPGWTVTYCLKTDRANVGFATVAIAGPWEGRPTLLEFYVVAEHRLRAFGLFESLLAVSSPQQFEVQSNDVLFFMMAHTFGRDLASDKIVFRDGKTTTYPGHGAVLRPTTDEAELKHCLEQRSGGGEWMLELDGTPIGKGGLLFHYNRPYSDVYMDIDEAYRRRGFGVYLVQELKRACYALGAVPAARCSPKNPASFKTLQRAGFLPYAHILIGSF